MNDNIILNCTKIVLTCIFSVADAKPEPVIVIDADESN